MYTVPNSLRMLEQMSCNETIILRMFELNDLKIRRPKRNLEIQSRENYLFFAFQPSGNYFSCVSQLFQLQVQNGNSP